MATGNKLIQLGVFLCLSLAVFAIIGACGTPAETVKEIEVIKEVPVDREVVKEVIKEVPVEVIKEVTKEVIVPQEVIKEVLKEVIKEVTVEVQVTPVPAEKETIIFSDLNWNSALTQNRIAQYIVEHGYGYPTDTILGFTLGNFQGLRAGDIHVTLEIWLPNQNESWAEALAAREVVSVGASLGRDWQSTFVVPAYLQEQYPDLDHVDDLKDPKYQKLFETNESRGKARLVACPPGWACEAVNLSQIAGHGLDEYLHVIHPGSQDAMFSEVYGAYEREEPWLGYMWGTADPGVLLDLVSLEQPEYSDLCWLTDKACKFEDATILIAVHPSLPPRAPEIVEFLHNWDYDIETYTTTLAWIVENDASHAEAAVWWLNNNQAVWSAWVTDEATAEVKKALADGKEAAGWPDT